MTATPPLTRDIGLAERTLGALLDRLLDDAGLSFPQWVVLNVLDDAGPLSSVELVRRQRAGLAADEVGARAAVDGLRSSGLIAPVEDGAASGAAAEDDVPLAATAAARGLFEPLREKVRGITTELYGDLPSADLDATHRTLEEIARRARARIERSAG